MRKPVAAGSVAVWVHEHCAFPGGKGRPQCASSVKLPVTRPVALLVEQADLESWNTYRPVDAAHDFQCVEIYNGGVGAAGVFGLISGVVCCQIVVCGRRINLVYIKSGVQTAGVGGSKRASHRFWKMPIC